MLMRFAMVIMLSVLSVQAATVVCLGDSLTAGYGLDEKRAYPALVAGLAEANGSVWNVVNAGVSGDTTAGGVRRVSWALRSKPDVVFIALGGNDGLRGLPVADIATNLAAIIDKVRATGALPILAGMKLPLNYGEDYRNAFADIFPMLAKTKNVILLPFLLEGVGGVPELNQADAIHPNAEGQRRIAALVYTVLEPLLVSLQR
jgi:acyl-CoA thioesterase I